MKLSHKYLLVSIAAIIIIPLIVGYMLYDRLKDQRLETITESVDRELAHLEFALDRFFENVKNDLRALSRNPVVRTRDSGDFTSFLDANEATFEYDYGPTELEIIRIFNDLRETHQYVNSVYMGRENGAFVRSHPRGRPTRYDPRVRPWYRIAKEHSGEIVRTHPYRSVTVPDVNLGIVTTLQDSSGEVYGVIGMDVTLVNLTDYISGCRVGRHGQIILTDSAGVILASQNRELLFHNIDTVIGDKQSRFLAERAGVLRYKRDNGDNYLFHRAAEGIGLKVGIIIPEEQINTEIKATVLPTILEVFVAIGLVAVLLLLGLSHFVLKPLDKLNKSTATIRRTGELSNRVDIDSRDEFGELASSFNSMIESLQKTRESLKQTEKELRKHEENLEALVKERTEELAASYDKLRELEKLRDDLTDMIIHDMRGPLTGIASAVELLKGGDSPRAFREELLEILDTSSSELQLMVETLLDVTRLENGEMPVKREECEILLIISKAVDTMRPITQFEKIEIEYSGDNLFVMADEHLTYRVICNLLSNAIKFSPSGEKVSIEVIRKGAEAVIEVHDKGPGISEEHREMIFEKFGQVEMRQADDKRSVGLGLTFCKMAVEAQGGEISVHGDVGVGSIFRFTLPLSK